jgi:hypothetical protein
LIMRRRQFAREQWERTYLTLSPVQILSAFQTFLLIQKERFGYVDDMFIRELERGERNFLSQLLQISEEEATDFAREHHAMYPDCRLCYFTDQEAKEHYKDHYKHHYEACRGTEGV